ncbi:MAG TPA: MFS transporter [Prosthecobacter sp.]|nr:MFS transporter [Prosthecobacter sp.]
MPPNVRLFIWFRLLFNCRFYYPVFTILFLDLGLSIAEFAALNVVWAVTIVLLEVPSGALADQVGRRRLVVFAGWLMVAEMAVLCLMPVGNHDAVLWLFVLNRVLSGAAEACASGADEALVYDSLPEKERDTAWSRAMAQLSRAMALGFIVSSISGSVLYDHTKVSAVFGWMGLGTPERAVTMKVPLVLNFLTGIACLLTTLRMREVGRPARSGRSSFVQDTRAAVRGILSAGRWIWQTPAALYLMVMGVVFDSIIRLFLTISSNFYRLVGIAEAWYGLIATVAAVLGLVTAGLMEWLSKRYSAGKNFAWLAGVTFVGLVFAAYPAPGWTGIALVMPIMLGIRFLHFFLSYYLNGVVDSEHRATVLSFRGLTMNLAYGAMTLIFGLHTHWLEGRLHLEAEDPRVFAASLAWWPWWFAGTWVVAMVCLRIRRGHRQFP